MDGENKKYISGLLKRLGIVVASGFLIAGSVRGCKYYKEKKESTENVDYVGDAYDFFQNYSIKFKN